MQVTSLMLSAMVADHATGSAHAHFMWAHVTKDGKHSSSPGVEVVFSEDAGVRDGDVLRDMWDDFRDHGMSHMTHTCCCKSYEFGLELNGKNVLEGDFFPRNNSMQNCSALASGHFDFGPYAPEHANDVQFSYNAQIYQKYSGFDDFFVPLMEKATYPSIVLRNCGVGGTDGEQEYQFALGGFPKGELDLCLYYQGGLEIGCGTFHVQGDRIIAQSLKASEWNIVGEEKPTLIYAQTKMRVADPEPTLLLATTSVYFEGACKD